MGNSISYSASKSQFCNGHWLNINVSTWAVLFTASNTLAQLPSSYGHAGNSRYGPLHLAPDYLTMHTLLVYLIIDGICSHGTGCVCLPAGLHTTVHRSSWNKTVMAPASLVSKVVLITSICFIRSSFRISLQCSSIESKCEWTDLRLLESIYTGSLHCI